MKRLALFDLDGTITHSDTLLEFLKFVRGNLRFYIGMIWLSPYLLSYKLGLYPNWRAKERTLTHFLAGIDADDLSEYGRKFLRERFDLLVRVKALDRINFHLSNGDDVAVVSASCEEWVVPWAQKIGIRAICTQLEKKEGRITGRILGRNNYGPEKHRRILNEIDLSDYDQIFAYGDSKGDREMFQLATHTFYKPF